MNRRHFFLSLAAPVVARRRARATDPIVIIGAGLAGLRAAELLRQAGASVIVLEGRSTPGGRVRTVRSLWSSDLHAEAGAIRISSAHARVLQLVREHRLGLVPFAAPVGAALVRVAGVTVRSPDGVKLLTGPLRLKPAEAGLTAGALIQRYADDVLPGLSDVNPTAGIPENWRVHDGLSWPDWLRTRGASEGAVTLMTAGGDSRQLSALYVLRQIALLRGSDQFFKIGGGMERLPRAMAASLGGILRYNARLLRIDRAANTLAVQYREGTRTVSLHAGRVILAIPCSMLSRLSIQPPLSADKARAIAGLGYFPATRFLLQVRRRFWEDDGLSGSARTDDPAELWDCSYDLPADAGILGVTAGGARGRAFGTMTEAQTLKAGVDLASRTFPRVRTEFQRGTAVRWARDPWAQGAFAVFAPGQMTGLAPALSRPEGRIHFAGEHTSAWTGWMEGALESGERAAREVLAA